MITSNKQLLKILNEIEKLSLNEEKFFDEAKNLIQKQETINKTEDKNYQKLLSYQIMFEDQMMWESRNTYLGILNSFLNNQIDVKSLCTQIQDLRCQNLDQAREAEANLNFKTDFNFTSKSIGFSSIIDKLDVFIDYLDKSESINENSLRSTIKYIILPKFLKYSDTS